MTPADELRIVWFFGRPYWWERDTDRRLTLRPARWVKEQP